jgi:hypothetical protein
MSEEKAVSELVERLSRWVVQQPEYPYLFLADRGRRKRAARVVAYRLLILPSAPPQPEAANRANIRRVKQGQSQAIGAMVGKVKKKVSRLEAKQQRDRARYRRLGVRRAAELAFAENAARDEASYDAFDPEEE